MTFHKDMMESTAGTGEDELDMEDHGTESMEALREGWRHAKQHRS